MKANTHISDEGLLSASDRTLGGWRHAHEKILVEGQKMSPGSTPVESHRQSVCDDIRSSKPTSVSVKTFDGGIGCAAIVAALIYAKRREIDGPPDSGN
jgi:hypothetical protein